jgi:hypothetical protein
MTRTPSLRAYSRSSRHSVKKANCRNFWTANWSGELIAPGVQRAGLSLADGGFPAVPHSAVMLALERYEQREIVQPTPIGVAERFEVRAISSRSALEKPARRGFEQRSLPRDHAREIDLLFGKTRSARQIRLREPPPLPPSRSGLISNGLPAIDEKHW